eukprot:TRINITY_DN103412_c0_g1_i1.p1 TRINITY_DN103412_c0_g1~~TRINITY_DN103412_c0_g1_i1.p1  ORF type:complete len:210 (+),score=48.37 TRINITY_DN103412_c0_g1_i1:67-696(+)
MAKLFNARRRSLVVLGQCWLLAASLADATTASLESAVELADSKADFTLPAGMGAGPLPLPGDLSTTGVLKGYGLWLPTTSSEAAEAAASHDEAAVAASTSAAADSSRGTPAQKVETDSAADQREGDEENDVQAAAQPQASSGGGTSLSPFSIFMAFVGGTVAWITCVVIGAGAGAIALANAPREDPSKGAGNSPTATPQAAPGAIPEDV